MLTCINRLDVYRQTTYVGPVFHPPPQSKHQPYQHQQHQQQAGRERQSQVHGGNGDGESSAPLERRPARRTNPATVSKGPTGSDTARPSSHQGDYHMTSHARPRILLIRSNTDRTSQQVQRTPALQLGRCRYFGYRYSVFSVFVIPTSVSVSVFENIAISVRFRYYRPTTSQHQRTLNNNKPTPRFARCRLALVYYRRCAAPTPSRRWRASAECHALQSQAAR